MNCRQCSGCAFKSGAAANGEVTNRLRGAFAALGGYVFLCHESLGWKHGKTDYPKGAREALDVIELSRVLRRCGVSEAYLQEKRAALPDIRVCGGWRAAVARLAAAGWFRSPAVRYIRRYYARRAAAQVDQGESLKVIKSSLDWFIRESKESGIDIKFLL